MKKELFFFVMLSFLQLKSFSQDWNSIKEEAQPAIALTSEFDSVYCQPLAVMGWEDGLHISPDGLHLYCTYVPIDFLSFAINGSLPNDFSDYLRGAPDFGMDLTAGASEWLQADILYASRNSIDEPFTTWTLSNMARAFYTEGAPSPLFKSTTEVELMAFTSIDNPTNNQDIWVISNTTANPSGIGSALPAPVNTLAQEDNPNIYRIDADSLVLFYDSEELSGEGSHDIWYTTSGDNGAIWATPSNLSSINTASKEHQPFLHKDLSTGKTYLYYSAYHSDNKLAIFRAEQNLTTTWNSWHSPELVISAGNTAGIGEPTLTAEGDLSFVVIYEDPIASSIYDHYDADPWYLRKKKVVTGLKSEESTDKLLTIFPNPAHQQITIKHHLEAPKRLIIYDVMGTVILDVYDQPDSVAIEGLAQGRYLVKLIGERDIAFGYFVKQ